MRNFRITTFQTRCTRTQAEQFGGVDKSNKLVNMFVSLSFGETIIKHLISDHYRFGLFSCCIMTKWFLSHEVHFIRMQDKNVLFNKHSNWNSHKHTSICEQIDFACTNILPFDRLDLCRDRAQTNHRFRIKSSFNQMQDLFSRVFCFRGESTKPKWKTIPTFLFFISLDIKCQNKNFYLFLVDVIRFLAI